MRQPWARAITLLTLIAMFSGGAFAANEKVIHVFKASPDGSYPIAPLIMDSQGNFYGTTRFGGAADAGTVFKLSPDGSGNYTYTQIYAFAFATGDAGQPDGGPLLMDGSGNLFGTTPYGGNAGGFGAVYELSPVAGGGWSEKVIYSFPCCTLDASYPVGGVVMDTAGNLYGASQNGGSNIVGTVFKLSPDGSGGWTESVLYSFTGSGNSGPDGAWPAAGVVFDAAGNLYGTTAFGGQYLDGIVFELSPGKAGGSWTEKVIHAFTGADGCNPEARLIVDTAHNVYGTTSDPKEVCAGGGGTVFRLSPSSGGWTETVLHHFPSSTHDGRSPNGIVLDSTGNIYGTTVSGGSQLYGEIYKLTPKASGAWTESVVHAFTGGPGGRCPEGGVTFGIDGKLYGTAAANGGPNGRGAGTVFRNQP